MLGTLRGVRGNKRGCANKERLHNLGKGLFFGIGSISWETLHGIGKDVSDVEPLIY